jgi:hypothetical protein
MNVATEGSTSKAPHPAKKKILLGIEKHNTAVMLTGFAILAACILPLRAVAPAAFIGTSIGECIWNITRTIKGRTTRFEGALDNPKRIYIETSDGTFSRSYAGRNFLVGVVAFGIFYTAHALPKDQFEPAIRARISDGSFDPNEKTIISIGDHPYTIKLDTVTSYKDRPAIRLEGTASYDRSDFWKEKTVVRDQTGFSFLVERPSGTFLKKLQHSSVITYEP